VTTASGPLKGGNITFAATGGKAYNPTGTISDDGSYLVSTFEENDGAPPGDYQVNIADAAGKDMTIKDGKNTITVSESSKTFDFVVE
jgi:hypothetical protein